MNDQKNTILAIVLSAIVLIGWQYFIGMPQMERQRQEALLKQQQAQQSQPPQPAPSAGAPAARAGAAPKPPGQADVTTPEEQKSRAAALAASARIPITTPEIKGSIDLKGGRIDDISLSHYRETVDPEFAGDRAARRRRAARTRSMPSSAGSAPPAPTVKPPGPDTVWERRRDRARSSPAIRSRSPTTTAKA